MMTDLHLCSWSGLPLCSDCQSLLERSEHTVECGLLQENSIKLTPVTLTSAKLLLSSVMVLRLLLKGGWTSLEHHNELRRGLKAWNIVEKHVIPLITMLKDENGNQLF